MMGLVLLGLVGVAAASSGLDLFPRDMEDMALDPIPWGPKMIQGGMGEGDQMMGSEGQLSNRQEVKSDSVLPAYCEPPNPCPPGHTAADGCLEDFENTAEFSRDWQARQSCLCDEEHMFSCPGKPGRADPDQVRQEADAEEAMAFRDSLQELLANSDIDPEQMSVAKKFHQKRGGAGPR